MACTSKVLVVFFAAAALLTGGHAHGKDKDDAANVFDVTEYGAAPSNRDNKDAFLAAWRAACGYTAAGDSTLLFPKGGTFAAGAVRFEGPCANGGAPAVVIDVVLRPCAGGAGCRLSDDAWITFTGLNNLLVTGAGTLDGGGKAKPKPKTTTTTTTTLLFDGVTNSTLSGLRLVNSRGFHVNLRRCAGITASGLGIRAPAASRNTDGVHVAFSSHVRVLDSAIGTGDDCVSVGPGSADVLVSGVACGPGHGISVGSLGKGGGGGGAGAGEEEEEEEVRGVVVRNCTVKGTSNGVRIKTWPGSPPGIAMDAVENPVVIDQRYCPHGRCAAAGDKPSLVQISGVTFRRIEGTSRTPLAVRLLCSEARPCTGVRLDGINLTCGGVPCRYELSNVQGPVAPVAAPATAPGVPREEEEEEGADVGSGGSEQLGRFNWWLPFTVRG
ncbi:unnamed protein product [Urochloa humidicola]